LRTYWQKGRSARGLEGKVLGFKLEVFF